MSSAVVRVQQARGIRETRFELKPTPKMVRVETAARRVYALKAGSRLVRQRVLGAHFRYIAEKWIF